MEMLLTDSSTASFFMKVTEPVCYPFRRDAYTLYSSGYERDFSLLDLIWLTLSQENSDCPQSSTRLKVSLHNFLGQLLGHIKTRADQTLQQLPQSPCPDLNQCFSCMLGLGQGSSFKSF